MTLSVPTSLPSCSPCLHPAPSQGASLLHHLSAVPAGTLRPCRAQSRQDTRAGSHGQCEDPSLLHVCCPTCQHLREAKPVLAGDASPSSLPLSRRAKHACQNFHPVLEAIHPLWSSAFPPCSVAAGVFGCRYLPSNLHPITEAGRTGRIFLLVSCNQSQLVRITT